MEMLEIRHMDISGIGGREIIMSNKSGFWFPLMMESKTFDKITGKPITMQRPVMFKSLKQATDWLTGN